MSNYQGYALNPSSGYVERAEFIDNYYGRHLYGVVFSDTQGYPEDTVVTFNANTSESEIDSALSLQVYYGVYVCTVEFCGDAWYGNIDNSRDLVTAQADSLSEICQEMVISIKDYEETLNETTTY